MGYEIQVDKAAFSERLSSFYSAWRADKRSQTPVFGNAGSIVVVMGKDSNTFHKNNVMHLWLLGYEFPSTLFVFTLEAMYVVTTAKKAKYIQPLEGGPIPVKIHVISKDQEQKVKAFDTCIDVIKASGKKVGVLNRDASSGPFVDEWRSACEEKLKEVEEVDIAPALSYVAFSVKNQDELISMRNASRACSGLMSEYFVEEMSQLLDEDKKITHKALAAKMDAKIDDQKFFNKLRLPSGFDHQELDWAYGPVIQSGGNYDLKISAVPDSNNLYPGIIITGFGIRYKTYCSVIARTFLVDPSKSQESNYALLLGVYDTIMKEIRDGAVIKDIYNKAVGMIKSKKPDLDKHFTKNIGFGIGIELQDPNMVLNGKNNKVMKNGMTFCVSVGFMNIRAPDRKDPKNQVYSMLISDTIRVGDTGAHVFTKDSGVDMDSISFYFGDEETPKPKAKTDAGGVMQKNITQTKLRSERPTQVNEGAEARRREHQKELSAKKTKEGLERFTGSSGDQNGTVQKTFRRFESYKRENQLPVKVKDLAVYVDQKAATVIVPIMGRPVPFHINTIKNASKSDEGEYAYLRINFLSPGQGVARKDDQPFEDPSAHFVRNLTLRSKDDSRLAQVAQDITDLKRNVLRREQERKEMEDVVEQEKLVEMRNRRPTKLPDVYLRPPLDGKRVPGEVEIHQNGLRYQSPLRGEHVDVLFSNVKHLFFQPSLQEMIVIIHVHLKTPIMIGKRKTKDVQFYREATEMQFDETGNRRRKHRFGDEEEFEAEQEERRRRQALDREFKSFADKISDAGRDEGVDVDVPFREIGFNGVPNRSNVYIQPTTDAIVQLTEPPFLVVTLSEIEIAHLERVQFGLKNFDLVFVFKDFSRPPVHVNTIPVESLESVKEWLDSVDIPFFEGPLNLNWSAIMKTVTSDPHRFFVDGGWSFLAAESDSEGSGEEEESAFEVSESELNASDEDSEEDSEFDDDASAEASDDASDEAMSEDGEDWDELEKKAKKKDREDQLEDGEKQKKRKRKFGKQIQRRQLELPEYAASFTNYKALKKLIKQLSASPTIPPASSGLSRTLRANKDVFFFRLERELDKVNAFYLQKEDEFTLRLKTLLDRKRVVQSKRAAVYAPTPLSYAALFEGVQQFDGDLNKLQQFVEINETAVSKILKKWDKTSKSRTKELYLQRAVEVQPCFNREKLRDLSDRATAAKLELEAWAEGENIQYSITTAAGAANAAGAINATASVVSTASGGTINGDDELQMLVNAASASGNEQPLRDHLARLKTAADEQSPVVAANETVTRIFLTAIADAAASDAAVMLLLQSGLVDLAAIDDINRRDTLHEAVISGRTPVFSAVLAQGVEPTRADVYGRLPLHYACMHGRVEMVTALLETTAGSATIDVADHDNFTPLIHSIVRDDLACIEQLVAHHAKVDPPDDDDSGGYHQIPLSLACKHASLLAVRLLLSRGAHILADAEGLYPQHIVARGGRALAPELLLVLCEHGADLDQRDRLYQWTPLFHAAAEGCVACLRTLLECGVDAATVDEKGLSAMYYAAWEGHLECMAVLWKIQEARGGNRMPPTADTQPATAAVMPTITSPAPSSSERALTPMEVDGIPDLSLPPPIIPIRHYGHNFLDTKALIQISFDAPDPIVFYQPGRYAAARLVVSSRTADFIPRNVLLPILADDARMLPFHVSVGGGDNNDNGDRVTAAGLAHFALDFDLFPTFGSRPIARTAALPDVFVHVANSRAGACSLPLFDPRLRTIGELRFRFAVIQPYAGTPLEISHFATYWKATAAAAAARDYDREREIAGASGTTATAVAMDAAVTGSSLSGNHVRLYVQMTRDHVPVLYPRFVISYAGLALPVCRLTFAEFERVRPPGVAAAAGLPPAADGDPANSSPSAVTESLLRVAVARLSPTDLPTAHAFLATAHLPLAGVLAHLPASININLHAVYPATAADERAAGLEPVPDVNVFADGMLTDLFAHARAAKAAADDGGSDNSSRAQGVGQSQAGLDRHFVRAVVLSSYCADVCVALNWKQPNYPVLLCNDLGQDRVPANRDPVTTCASPSIIDADGRASMSVKDSARIGRENNLMGLVCRASLLDAMPALVHTVKTQGLVLVADCADEDITPSSGVGGNSAAVSSNGPTPSAMAYPATDPLMPALAPVSTPAAASTPPPARPKTIAETLAAARAAREAAESGTIGVAGLRPSPASTHTPASGSRPESRSGVAAQRSPGSNEQAFRMPEGVNGVVRKTGVLRFHDTIDM